MNPKNKPGPPNQTTQARSYHFDHTRASQIPKENKRRRHDDELMIDHDLHYSIGQTDTLSEANNPKNPKSPIKSAYVAKHVQKIPNNQKATMNNHKPAPPEVKTPNREQNYTIISMNTSSPSRDDLDLNNSNKSICHVTVENIQDDPKAKTIATEDNASYEANEEAMIT
jgi:hypothetical protein